MLEKGVAKSLKIIKKVSGKYENRIKNMRTNDWKKRKKARCGLLPQGPGNTIRSKIEDKITEEKLNDRENATYPKRDVDKLF